MLSVRAGFCRLTLACVVLLAVGCQSDSSPAPLDPPAPDGRTLSDAKDLFYRSVAGDRQSLPIAQRKLKELGGEDATDPQVTAYLGACKLLAANRAALPWEKASLAQQGLELEDRAVTEAPADFEIRFLRGVTNFVLPRFLGRWPTAVADLTAVAQVAAREAAAGRLDPRAAAAALDYHGKLLEAQCDLLGAIADWRVALRLSPDSPGGHDAAKHLREHQLAQ